MKRIFESFDLTAWRVRMGLTQQSASETLETHLRTYQQWERDGKATRLAVKHAKLLEKLREMAS